MKYQTKDKIIFFTSLGVFISGLIALIFIAGFLYGSYSNAIDSKEYDGCWASVQDGENAGEWVCVNILGMDFKRALEVCKHEVGHEIFAEVCEKDIDKCFEVVDG